MNIDSAVLYTNNIEAIKKFYLETIGLKLEYQQGDKFVSFLFDNGVRLSIKKSSCDREKPGFQTIFISTDSIESLFKKFKKLNLTFYKELSLKEWGSEFSILDPDGNKVEFIERK